jgi:multicomponent K+:H+ antiporter subunit F
VNAFFHFSVNFAFWCCAGALSLALIRLFRGPSAQDRVLAFDAFYSTGMLILLILGIRFASRVHFDIALLIALLGFLGTTALAKFLLRGEVIEP